MLKTFLKQWMPSSCKETVRQQIEIKPEWGEGLKHYLDTKLPKPDIKLGQIDAVAVDFETTGLNSEVDHILSIGMVPCTLEIVDAASSLEILVNHGQFIKPETALVNELTPEVLEGGVSLDDAMDTLFNAIAGKVVVAHGAWIEKSFIKSYLLKRYQQKDFPCYFLDTLNIEKKHSFREVRDIIAAISWMIFGLIMGCRNTCLTGPPVMLWPVLNY